MCVLSFSTKFVCNIFHYNKNWARYDHKCLVVFMWSTRYSYVILMQLEFSRQFLQKYSSTNFHEILPMGTKLFHKYRRTDGQTWRS